jgi:hypothetical protein
MRSGGMLAMQPWDNRIDRYSVVAEEPSDFSPSPLIDGVLAEFPPDVFATSYCRRKSKGCDASRAEEPAPRPSGQGAPGL